MNCSYEDIRSRISEPARWWDEHAVPRYCAFAPRAVANIYAVEVALVEIACQNCGTRFDVAFSRGRHEYDGTTVRVTVPFDPQRLHYGDPPNVGCCASGPTMNSEPLRVLECWIRDDPFTWRRLPEKEGAIPVCEASGPEPRTEEETR